LEDPFKVYTYNANDGFSRWALGYLLEAEGFVTFSGWRPSVYWDGHGLNGAYPINALLIESSPSEYELRDYFVSEEELVQIKRSNASASAFLGQIAAGIKGADARVHSFMRALSAALHDANPALQSFYAYQEEAAREILASLGLLDGGRHRVIAVSARTAGGKTLAFFVPVLISIFCEEERAGRPGVKAILMYPTKALANDQLEEVAHLLFYLTERLREVELAAEITFGCLHGNVYDANNIRDLISGGRDPLLPVKCPNHDVSVGLRLEGEKALAFCPKDANCRFARFLNERMRKTREEVYFAPPDVLITDEDMVNRILSGAPKRHKGAKGGALWYEWQLLGYPYKRCKACLHTYPETANVGRCAVCGSDMQASVEAIREVSRPSIIVLDEAHQLFGSFGVQVSHMLSLLERVLRSKPTYVLASATLGKAKDFAAGLLGVQPSEVKEVAAEVEAGAGERAFRRAFALVMPKAYTRDATLVRLLAKFLEEFVGRGVESGKPPRGIVFTNTLAESNEVLQHLRNEVAGSLRIDGHSTDFNEERIDKELDFKAGKIDWFVATSTLELGIDYGVVDFVTIYGVPPKVTSFVQRVGRAGRGKDAVVFIVFDPESPINYSYYENYKLLCDGSIRDKAIECEVMPVGAMNREAVRRAVRRWAVSEVYRMCSSGAAPTKIIIDGLDSPDQRVAGWKRVASSLKTHILGDLPASLAALYIYRLIESYRQIIDGEVGWLEQKTASEGSSWRDASDFVDSLDRYALYDLRAADETIEICYTPLGDVDRPRELRYAIRHGLWGQVTSFRGNFFTVTAVDVEEKRNIEEWFSRDSNALERLRLTLDAKIRSNRTPKNIKDALEAVQRYAKSNRIRVSKPRRIDAGLSYPRVASFAYLICPKCRRIYNYQDVKSFECPRCSRGASAPLLHAYVGAPIAGGAKNFVRFIDVASTPAGREYLILPSESMIHITCSRRKGLKGLKPEKSQRPLYSLRYTYPYNDASCPHYAKGLCTEHRGLITFQRVEGITRVPALPSEGLTKPYLEVVFKETGNLDDRWTLEVNNMLGGQVFDSVSMGVFRIWELVLFYLVGHNYAPRRKRFVVLLTSQGYLETLGRAMETKGLLFKLNLGRVRRVAEEMEQRGFCVDEYTVVHSVAHSALKALVRTSGLSFREFGEALFISAEHNAAEALIYDNSPGGVGGVDAFNEALSDFIENLKKEAAGCPRMCRSACRACLFLENCGSLNFNLSWEAANLYITGGRSL
jgi:ATP-dependent helicase YprA (DUF1998 family)